MWPWKIGFQPIIRCEGSGDWWMRYWPTCAKTSTDCTRRWGGLRLRPSGYCGHCCCRCSLPTTAANEGLVTFSAKRRCSHVAGRSGMFDRPFESVQNRGPRSKDLSLARGHRDRRSGCEVLKRRTLVQFVQSHVNSLSSGSATCPQSRQTNLPSGRLVIGLKFWPSTQ